VVPLTLEPCSNPNFSYLRHRGWGNSQNDGNFASHAAIGSDRFLGLCRLINYDSMTANEGVQIGQPDAFEGLGT
jgi:hypothetical protein